MTAGVCRGDPVALLTGSGPEWIVACLAVIEAGGIAVPLDVQLEENMRGRVLKDSGARLLFTTGEEWKRIQPSLGDAELSPILLDAEIDDPRSWRRLLSESPAVLLPELGPDEAATLFYTSGTTGSSKGVPLTHGNLVFQINTVIEAKLITHEDRLLLPLPLHHVYPFVIGMLLPLAMGLPIVLPQSLTGPQIVRAMREGEVTAVVGVPRLYDALCAAIEARLESGSRLAFWLFKTGFGLSMWLRRFLGLRLGKLLLRRLHQEFGQSLRIMASGGAALAPELAWKLEALGWQVAIGYGLTETAPLLTLNPPGAARIGSVGKAIPGVELRVDRSGEVLARGPNVFAGYRNLPTKTTAAFTEDGWFRTGDLGYFDDDNYLHLTGRVSTLIVTAGGEKIQPEDVEDAYQESPVMSEVGVLQKDGRLVAVIVPKLSQIHASGGAAINQAIREAVQGVAERLPSYQRVSDFVLTRDSLARTRLGKIRRHLLAERYEHESLRRKTPASTGPIPRDEMSAEDLALLEDVSAKRIWDLLAHKYPDKRLTPGTSPQLDLGFDSLEWLNLTLEIRERTGVDLSEEAIGRISTVRDLLREVSEGQAGEREISWLEQPEDLLSEKQKRWLKPHGAIASLVTMCLYALNWVVTRTLFGLRVKGRSHLPTDKPFVLVPNHLSYLDPQVIAAALGYHQLRQTYWGGWTGVMTTNPLNRLFSRLAQVVPIDADRALISSLSFGAAVLERGNNLVWFPEGAMSRTGRLQPFKGGIGILLERFQTLVLPVAIHGTDQAMPPGKLVPRRTQVTVAFGCALSVRDLERQGQGSRPHERIASALREHLVALQQSDSQPRRLNEPEDRTSLIGDPH